MHRSQFNGRADYSRSIGRADFILERQIALFENVHPEYGAGVRKALGR